MRLVSFYLPQFHEIPENNKAWGKGFTEWDNVRKAVPLFENHNQPREPLDDNYYNLLDVNTIKWQTELAKKYGIYGFCFYHYWFRDGKHVLEKPAEILLANEEIDMPFCFSWANEPWTKTWHGAAGEKEVLLEQRYGKEEQWKEHFEYFLPFFKDKRYIRVENKPVLLIYQINKINCFKKMVDYWNKLALDHGEDGIYIVDMLTGDGKISKDKRVSASVDFEPGKSKRKKIADEMEKETCFFQDYEDSCQRMLSVEHNRNEWQCIFVDYDDTPRRKNNGIVYLGSTPEKFGGYLQKMIQRANKIESEFVFINAWNEWGEGNYLEPDKKNGYAYLEAVAKALNGEYEDFAIKKEYEETIIGSESKREAKFRKYYELCNAWIKLNNDGYRVEDYFRQKRYQKIAVYGMGELANRLIEALDQTEIEVLYGIDQDTTSAFAEIDIIGFEEKDFFTGMDCIVVTPIHLFDILQKKIKEKTDVEIISLEDIIYSI